MSRLASITGGFSGFKFVGRTTSAVVGQAEWISPTTTTWTVPAGVYSISMVSVGGGQSGYGGTATSAAIGGAGGALAYRNSYAVTPGQVLDIIVGAGGLGVVGAGAKNNGSDSIISISGTIICQAKGGTQGGFTDPLISGQVSYGGGYGGSGSWISGPSRATNGGGGGAGGYSGVGGGHGGDYTNGYTGLKGSGGSGGGGSGSSSANYNERGGGGGGVGIYGLGTTAAAGNGNGGSGGTNQYTSATTGQGGMGGSYGGGGGGARTTTTYKGGDGGDGAVRIIWPGNTRLFPATGTADV